MKHVLITILTLLFVVLPSVAQADEAALLEEIDALRDAAEGFQEEVISLRAEANQLRVSLAEKNEVILNLNLEITSLRKIVGTHLSDLDAKESERLMAYMNWQDTEKELKAVRVLWVSSLSAVSVAFAAALIKSGVDAQDASN